MNNIETLRVRWSDIFVNCLPAAARVQDPAQPKWPVHVDHCFSRIILDNVVGEAKRPWMKALRAPAVKNMNEAQLRGCIELGEKILNGNADLVELDRISLSIRGKAEEGGKSMGASGTRQRATTGTKRKPEAASSQPSNKMARSRNRQGELTFNRRGPGGNSADIATPDEQKELHSGILRKIASDSSLTPYQKRLYSTLLSVPLGRFTTYSAMSDYLDSSARAVGNGMRSNPFAPDVPCHRVLAADGTLGGFKGDWGEKGKYASNKLELLGREGVKFDSRGKVLGTPFRDLHDLSAA